MTVRHSRRTAGALLLLGCALLLTSNALAQSRRGTRAGWDALVVDFLKAYFVARPDFAVGAGLHEFDGQLPDWSDAGISAFDSLLTVWKARVSAYDTTALDADRRLERQMVLVRIDRDLWFQKTYDAPHRSTHTYAGSLDPDPYVSR